MEAQLRANDHKGGWAYMTFSYLLRRLREEVDELEQAVKYAAPNYEIVVKEAADVGNFAMFIADSAATWKRDMTKEGG